MKKLFGTRVSENALGFGLFLLRVVMGGLMLVNHGYDKLTHFSRLTSQVSDPFGVGKTASASMLVFAEFFCAALIVLGLFTRLAAIPLIIAMSVAFVSAHKMSYGEGELALMFLVSFLVILVTGPGKASIDRLIWK